MADISIEACLLLQPAIDLWTRKRWYTVAPANHHCNFESSETRLRENPPVWRKETEERGRVNRVFLTICCRGGKTTAVDTAARQEVERRRGGCALCLVAQRPVLAFHCCCCCCSMTMVLLTSGEGVHKWRLWQSWWSDHLLGFADLRVRFSKLQPDGLGQVGIEPNSLLQKNWCETRGAGAPLVLDRVARGWQMRPPFPAKSWPSEANWGEKGGKKLVVSVGLAAWCRPA